MSKLAAAIVSYLQNWISPFLINKKLFTDTDSARALVIAFDHRFQNYLRFQRFPSVTSSRTRVWNWSLYINYLKATPCLKPADCWMQCSIFDCSIMFDCLSVRFPNFRLCSIAEPNRSHSNDWSSIEFDWLRRDRLNFIMTLLLGRSE